LLGYGSGEVTASSDACFWWVMAVQEQKEAAMIKALENNMGDVDMVSAEGEVVGCLLCFDNGDAKLILLRVS
jgi:hypothetical protein